MLSLRRYLGVSNLDMTRSNLWYATFGLSLLYSSAYFIPLLSPTGLYLLPSSHLFELVILPSLVAVVCIGALIYLVSMAARRWFSPWVATCGAIAGLSLLTLIGIKGFMNAAGYDVESLVPRGQTLQGSVRNLKILSCIALVVLLWARRRSLAKIVRILSSVGFAFGVLAAVQVFLSSVGHGGFAPTASAAAVSRQPAAAEVANLDAVPPVGARTRRVVWVVFDETDLDRVYRSGSLRESLPNFERMAHASVFAADANSPASATFYSIPALLSGVPIGGTGVKIDSHGAMLLERVDGKTVPFDEATSIFGALAAEGRSASVLGFYHPYCKIFTLTLCDSLTFPELGLLGDHHQADSRIAPRLPAPR
jgi:hypothetical protein